MYSPNFIKTAQAIALALMMGVTTFLGVVLSFLSLELHFSTDFNNDILILIVLCFTLICAIMSKLIYTKQFEGIENYTLDEKKQKFQTAVIISLALLEGPALFAVSQLMLTGNLIYLIAAVVLMILMLISFPTFFKFEMVCKLSKEEKNQLIEF